MGKLKQKKELAIKALQTLREVLNEEYSMIVRDAAIQRFEYSFEAVWKASKAYLQQAEGIIANSPKAVFREMFSAGLLTDEKTKKMLEMVDDRNITTHTYIEEVAEQIFNKLPHYCKLMRHIIDQMD